MKQIVTLILLLLCMSCTSNIVSKYEAFPFPETIEVNGFVYKNYYDYKYILVKYPEDININSIYEDDAVIKEMFKEIKSRYPQCCIEFSSISNLRRFYIFDVWKIKYDKSQHKEMRNRALKRIKE